MPAILIVDDDLEVLNSVSEVLHELGYRAFKANSAKSALDVVAENDVDLALLDIRLPDGNGVDIGRTIRALNPDVGLVMMSGMFWTPDPVDRAGSADAKSHPVRFLKKPFGITQLRCSIEATLRSDATGGCAYHDQHR